jgi:hypothetical protein
MEDLGEVKLTDNVGNLVGTAHGTLAADHVSLTDWRIKPVNLFKETTYIITSTNQSWSASFCGWDVDATEAGFDVSHRTAA